MGEKYEGRDVGNVRLSSSKEINRTKPFAIGANRPVVTSLSKENVSFDRENASLKKINPLRFEGPSDPGGLFFNFEFP